ncbi:hypothetical protein EMGBS15_09380 [Filimonas sp.]|nr:hypothetical protein EMGBS15_09380 [Filimonas sp.]
MGPLAPLILIMALCCPSATAFNGAGLIKGGNLFLLSEVMYSDTSWIGIAVNNDQQADQWLIKIDTMGIIKNRIRIGGAYDDWASWINSNSINGNLISECVQALLIVILAL